MPFLKCRPCATEHIQIDLSTPARSQRTCRTFKLALLPHCTAPATFASDACMQTIIAGNASGTANSTNASRPYPPGCQQVIRVRASERARERAGEEGKGITVSTKCRGVFVCLEQCQFANCNPRMKTRALDFSMASTRSKFPSPFWRLNIANNQW